MENKKFSSVAANEDNSKWNNIIKRQSYLYKRETDVRSEFQRDYDRILYSNAYKRLKHKTQVFFSPTNDHVCTRIEHVNYVESISYSIADALGLNLELTRAMAIAHDLGHSPFGHGGERILNEISLLDCDKRFWHERNGLDLVDNIELLEDSDGYKQNLNLTYGVRDGIISHCGEVDENAVKPRDEYIDLKDYVSANQFQPYTWEGCVVKVSDKISYIGRDIEDAIRFKILSEFDILELSKILNIKGKVLNNTNIVNGLTNNLIENSTVDKGLFFSKDKLELLDDIKKFNNKYIYNNSRIANGKKYFRLVLTTIYEVLKSLYNETTKRVEIGNKINLYPQPIEEFMEWLSNYTVQDIKNKPNLKNKKIYDLSKKEDYYLSVIEYISRMTDNKAIDTYNKIISF